MGMPDIKMAQETLKRYKQGKANLEARIRENERWYKLRHWEMAERGSNPGDPEPTSAWLLNSIANKHADAMDNIPEPVVLPREEGDRANAEVLSAIVPVIMERQDFEDVYSKHWWRKLRSGTGVYGTFWDKTLENGLGDIAVKDVDLMSLYWEPGQDDIQLSRNVFYTTLMDNDLLVQRWPELDGRLGSNAEQAEYIHDESIDNSDKSCVVDWYYKLAVGGRTVLHYCKFCGDAVLYASEDDPACAETGYYAHGKYPFVMDTLFPVEDSPAGFGWLDVCKDPQLYIDKLNQVILKNAVWGSRPRFFVRNDGGVNEAEYADTSKDFVHYKGGDPRDSIMPIEVQALSPIYATVLANKVDELKETSGNRDFSQGGTSGGVSAASAIAALQEAGSKLSRDMLTSSYRAYKQVCYLVIELIRQFYDERRTFRITGANGAEQYVAFSGQQIAMRPQGSDFGVDMGMVLPVFDIEVRAQKRSAYSTLAQNEMAKEFYAAGFFNPEMADQALACLEMMDFEGKAQVVKRIQQNGTMMQQMLMMQQQLAQMTDIINGMTGGALGQPEQQPGSPAAQPQIQTSGGAAGASREALAGKAREKAQNVAGVRI